MTKTLIAAGAIIAAATAAAQAVVIDLGTLPSPSRVPTTVTGNLEPNDLVYVTFTLPTSIDASEGDFFDINTNASSFDTEIGLYAGNIFNAASTTLVASDDDSGIATRSTLTFGAGSGMEFDDFGALGGDNFADGEDGDLPAGQYTLVFGEFNVTFGPTVDTAVSTGFDTGGDYQIDFFIAVPEPTTAALAGLGGLAMLRRRRA